METPPLPFIFPPKPDLFGKYKYYLLALLLLIFIAGLYLLFSPPKATLADGPNVQTAGASELTPASNGQIVVDVAGGVKQAGIYWLNSGSIVEDAVKAAGGFSQRADLNAIGKTINRAQELANHGKVYVPKLGDTAVAYTNPAAADANSPININSASNTELDLLPGIGAILSQRIIDYRMQNGNFKSIDELKKVAGINSSRFDQIKDLVTI